VYILNSLEKLGFEEYMYRLLREDGYNRVISFELNENKLEYTICAYDKLSYCSYIYRTDFENLKDLSWEKLNPPDEKNREIIMRFYQEKEGEKATGPQGLTFKPKRDVVSPKTVAGYFGRIPTSIEAK
jgi:hypothetical protein